MTVSKKGFTNIILLKIKEDKKKHFKANFSSSKPYLKIKGKNNTNSPEYTVSFKKT